MTFSGQGPNWAGIQSARRECKHFVEKTWSLNAVFQIHNGNKYRCRFSGLVNVKLSENHINVYLREKKKGSGSEALGKFL